MSFVCYLDDSCDQHAKVYSLAGYFALEENWEKYEAETRRVYAAYDIEILHSVLFAHGHAQFKGWTRARKHDLVQDLFILARAFNIMGTSFSITRDTCEAMKKAHKGGAQLSPLLVLFGALSSAVTQNEGLFAYIGQRNVSFAIESGNKNNQGIISNFNRQKRKTPDPVPRVKAIQEVSKADCRAIHLADFWAFYSRRAVLKMIKDDFAQDDDVMSNYLDPLALSAAIRGRHTINVMQGFPSPIPGQPNRFIMNSTRGYEFGPLQQKSIEELQRDLKN